MGKEMNKSLIWVGNLYVSRSYFFKVCCRIYLYGWGVSNGRTISLWVLGQK